MANMRKQNPIYLDTFTAVIDFATQFPKGMKLGSIEWVKPTDTAHTFTILSGGSGGAPIFSAQCELVSHNVIKYFNGVMVDPLYLAVAAANEKASGAIIITLEGQEVNNVW